MVGALPALWLLYATPSRDGGLGAVDAPAAEVALEGAGGSDELEEAEATPPPPPGVPPIQIDARTETETIRLEPGEHQGLLPLEVAFELRSDHAFPDLRLRLFDEAGRMVPGEESITVGEGTRATWRPSAPLIPGTAYKLVVDGQAGQHLVDAGGERFAQGIFSFRTEGEKPAPPPSRRRGRR